MKMIATLLIVAFALVGPVVAGAQTTTAPAAPAAPETTKPAPPDTTKPTTNDPAATTSPAPSTSAPASPATPAPATPGSEAKPGATPGTAAPNSTAPRAQTPGTQAPGTAGGITDTTRDDGRIFGLSPWAAIIGGLIVLGVLVALLAGRGRRDSDVVVESRTETRLTDDRPPVGTYESEIERERRRRAS